MNRPICQTLKQLRMERSLTQETVAQQLHVTRQTVSSYESGRTQPDLDTLIRLAQVYQVELETILYGAPQADPGRLWLRRAALAVSIFFSLFILIASFLYWDADTFWWLGEHAIVTPEVKVRLDHRMALTHAVTLFQQAALLTAKGGGTVLLVLSCLIRCPTPWKHKLLWFAGTAICAVLAALPWYLLDPHRAYWNYAAPIWHGLSRLAVFLLLSLAFDRIRYKHKPTS